MNLPPYYPTVKGITDYAVWQLVYPDSLLKADIAGEAVCTLRIDSLGIVRSNMYKLPTKNNGNGELIHIKLPIPFL